MDNMYTLCSMMKEMVEELKMEQDTASIVEKLLGTIKGFSSLDVTETPGPDVQSQLEQLAVTVWNFTVAKKTGGSLAPILNAKLREVATGLVTLTTTAEMDVVACRKYLTMTLKTARAWIDAEEVTHAEKSLTLATQCLQQLRKSASTELGKSPGVEREEFKLLCYQSEVALGTQQGEAAICFITQAKELLPRLPQEVSYLAMLCYNFGVERFKKNDFEQTIIWLRQSYETGKENNAVSNKNQARTLRLLANAYLELDSTEHCQKALNAIGLANTECPHPAGMYLKIRILLEGHASDERLQSGLTEILHHHDLSVDLGLNTIKLVFQHKRLDAGFAGLDELGQRFKNSPQCGKVYVTQLDMMIKHDRVDKGRTVAEQIITGHHTSEPLDLVVLKRLHYIIWEQAARSFEAKEFSEALQWYNYSLSVSPQADTVDKNMAKLHRNRASCFIGMNKLEEAKEALVAAQAADTTAPYTFYLRFKLALLQEQEEEAMDALLKMCDSAEHTTDTTAGTNPQKEIINLICLAAQLSFERSHRSLAVRALESLTKHSTDCKQVLTSLRCLTRLRLTFLSADCDRSEVQALLGYFRTAYEKLSNQSEMEKFGSAEQQQEATWFMKIALNFALQCEKHIPEMYELFILYYKLTSLCATDVTGLIRQKTCLLMASAASLQMARSAPEGSDKAAAPLRQALARIADCRRVCDQIKAFNLPDTDVRTRDNTTPVLLLLYEFEARLGLGESGLDEVLERARGLPNQPEPKVFETLASLAMEGAHKHSDLSQRALKLAIQVHLQKNPVNYERCSKALHSLIQLSLDSCNMSDPTSLQPAWPFFTQAVTVVDTKAQGQYPEIEVLWLMTKAWNCGIHLYSANNFGDAVRWCELAMRLLKHVGSLKTNYETQMTRLYTEILMKMEGPNKELATTQCATLA